MLSTTQTRALVKAFYEGACAQQNVGHLACLINLKGCPKLMAEFFTVRGFRELLTVALPPEQRGMGHLGSK